MEIPLTTATYITPSYYAFYVWSLIHLLLLGTMIFQFTTRGNDIVVGSIHWRFALLGILNSVYVFFWSRHWYILAFVLSLFVSATVSQIYYVVKKNHSSREGWGEELFVHLPFSLYHGCESPIMDWADNRDHRTRRVVPL